MIHPRDILKEVDDGLRDPIEAAILLKRMSETLEDCYQKVREQAATTFTIRYGDKAEELIDGATVKYSHGRAVYDYKMLPAWVKKKAELVAIEKEAQTAARARIERGESLVNEETGEVIQPCGIEYTKPGIVISL